MDHKPLVTVAIPTIGRPLLRQTIETLLEQTFTDWQAIVSDNANSDETKKTIESFGDPRIRYVGQPVSLGSVGNPNYCLEISDTELCVVMHDDDYFHPEYLSTMVEAMQSNPSAGWGFSNAYLVKETGGEPEIVMLMPEGKLSTTLLRHGKELIEDLLLQKHRILMPNVIYRREVYTTERFDSSFISMCDLKMWLKLSMDFDAVYVERPIFFYRCWSGNGSHDRALEGTFFNNAIDLYEWLKELDNQRHLNLDLPRLRHGLIWSHCVIVLWNVYLARTNDLGGVFKALDRAPCIEVSFTKFLLRCPRLLVFLGSLGCGLRSLFRRVVKRKKPCPA